MKKINLNLVEFNIKNDVFSCLGRVDNLYFASRVERPEDFKKIKEMGIHLCIDMKSPSENVFDEKHAAEINGLKYYSIPISSPGDFTFNLLQNVLQIFEVNTGLTLMYCASANRTSMWLASHMVKICGHSKERAIELSRKLGLRESVEPALRANLSSLQGASGPKKP